MVITMTTSSGFYFEPNFLESHRLLKQTVKKKKKKNETTLKIKNMVIIYTNVKLVKKKCKFIANKNEYG